MSRCLSDRSIDHVVLERGEIAHSWRTERWDSLRLLTPNWQSRLPGYGYSGNDPDGYRTVPEVVEFIDGYASAIAAPVQTHTTVVGGGPGRESRRDTSRAPTKATGDAGRSSSRLGPATSPTRRAAPTGCRARSRR
jgi:cation diffusion facilitator CzcD-associated flavoprotein CzcO